MNNESEREDQEVAALLALPPPRLPIVYYSSSESEGALSRPNSMPDMETRFNMGMDLLVSDSYADEPDEALIANMNAAARCMIAPEICSSLETCEKIDETVSTLADLVESASAKPFFVEIDKTDLIRLMGQALDRVRVRVRVRVGWLGLGLGLGLG